MIRRVLGLIMLLVAVAGIAIGIGAIVLARQFVDDVGTGVDETLVLTADSLENIRQTLLLAKDTVTQVNESIETVEETVTNLGQSISQTRPLLQQVNTVTSQDVPTSLEAVQQSLPNVSNVAAAIDETLTTLNDFRINQTILGIPIRYDLGINYDPEIPFNESIDDIGTSLEGMPERLRSMGIYINVADNNLVTATSDMRQLARDLDGISDSVQEINPLLDEYIRIVGATTDLVRQTRTQVRRSLATAKTVLTLVFAWFALTQVAPLYLGIALLRGRRLHPPGVIVLPEEEIEELLEEKREEAEAVVSVPVVEPGETPTEA